MIHLPFDDAWPEIRIALERHRNLVLVAEPGAGKTTRLPAMLVESGIVGEDRVMVLEPRRIATRAAAIRISEERGWKPKEDVGYSVRFDHQMTDATRLSYLTEGLFLRKLTDDPKLKGISAIVLDEFHERSRYTDIAIAALKELQFLERPDLRIVVMSATIDAQRISEFLAIDSIAAPVIEVPGRTFPVEVKHSNEPLMLQTGNEWIGVVAKRIKHIVRGQEKRIDDLLVFFPGVGEIRRTRELLEADPTFLELCRIMELHGSLTLDEQSQALTRDSDSRPRVILATNIAETSLTLNGVGTVLDTGLARVSRADRLGFSRLVLERISLASAKQRTGRAGRTAPGLSYRMWSKMDELSFPEFGEAELRRVDLTDSLLELYGIGVNDPLNFDWFERPSSERLDQAIALLRDLGAVDQNRRITDLGKRLHATSLPARAARMIIESEKMSTNDHILAHTLAAILFEKDFVLDNSRDRLPSGSECDLHFRARILDGDRGVKIDRVSLSTVRKVIQNSVGSQIPKIDEIWNDRSVARLLLAGYPDRVARRRKKSMPQARMTGGRGVELHISSTVREYDLFFALRGDAGTSRTSSDALVTMASGVSKQDLIELAGSEISSKSNPVFDESSLTVYNERATAYRDLPLESGVREGTTGDVAFEILKREFFEREKQIQASRALASFSNRIRFLMRNSEGDGLIQAWHRAIDEVLYGERSLKLFLEDEGAEKLADAWERNLANVDGDLARRLSKEAPVYFTAPTGNKFRIHYPADRGPYVEVRLQELFGVSENPKIATQPLTFQLLGPNYRPVQVTSDLPGFWKGSYFEVRKELRARYPKHSWPEDPLVAPPVAKGPRRRD